MSTVTRQQILHECSVAETTTRVPASQMQPGTLALSDGTSNILMLITNGGCWGVLFNQHVANPEWFGTAYSSTHGIPLLTGISADAWPRICAETSQIRRIRIARAAAGLPPSEDELLEAAGLAQLPGLMRISSAPSGTLLLHGKSILALMQDNGRWSWLFNNDPRHEGLFDRAGFELQGHPLITGIPEVAWPELRSAISNAERVQIAVASVSASVPPTGSDVSKLPHLTTRLTPPTWQRELADLLQIGYLSIYCRLVSGSYAGFASSPCPFVARLIGILPGSTLIVAIRESLGAEGRPERLKSIASWLLRRTDVDHVRLIDGSAQDWISLSMPKPRKPLP